MLSRAKKRKDRGKDTTDGRAVAEKPHDAVVKFDT